MGTHLTSDPAATPVSPPLQGYPTQPLAASVPVYGMPQPTYAAPPPLPSPASVGLSPYPSPGQAVPQLPGPQAYHATTPEPTTTTPSPHMYSYSYSHSHSPSPLYSCTNASYPGPQYVPPPHPPGFSYPGPYYPPQPTYAFPDGPAPPRLAIYPPPLPPRSAPGLFAPGFGSDPRNAMPYPPPPKTLYTPPPLPAGRPRTSSSSMFSSSSARRWLDKTSQMLESKLDEVLQGPQGPPHRPAYGPPPGSHMPAPAPGHGGYRGGSWGGGSYRYA
ncbi:uncharacterized protein HRG_04499 [Hirsutella rhossiliensis]|uniref:Uncharacterized protein n=1 Tax=Hirsutella rhossiliensis TaxID=111463 RepID=A0A9P8SKF0_9HYPO|nr:uncharacterized protein HRG_04499 [Hirsutella rhossiliensis]KAH0964071.1 hypothetical protein HRG_04499 [Hirsutella rhossiliensis]